MKSSDVSYLLGCVLALTTIGFLAAQGAMPATTGATVPAATEKISFEVLKGAWVRYFGGADPAGESRFPEI